MDYDKLNFAAIMRGFNKGYSVRDLQGNSIRPDNLLSYEDGDKLLVTGQGGSSFRTPKLKQEFKLKPLSIAHGVH